MYARNVSIHLKANTAGEFTRTLEKDVLPVLRKQTGFKDEISFLTSDRSEAFAISLWDRKEDADNYNRDIYPQVLTSLAKVRSEEHTSELQSRLHLVCRLLLEKKKRQLAAHSYSRKAATHAAFSALIR